MERKFYLFLLGILFISIIFILFFFLSKYMHKNEQTIVVLDMDETLGHFVEFSVFYDIIENLLNKKLSYDDFSGLLDMYPEFLRPNILKILSFIKLKKKNGECDKVIVYTNNQGPREWAEFIIRYFEDKINYNLFDQIIGAYKIGNKINENKRTGHEKSVDDLLNCSGISKSCNICFVDDQYHSKMRASNVFYINLKPYVYVLPYEEMGERYYKYNKNLINDKNEFINGVVKNMKFSNYNEDSFGEINDRNSLNIGKDVLLHLQQFFRSFKRNNTKKRNNYKRKIKNITIKNNRKKK